MWIIKFICDELKDQWYLSGLTLEHCLILAIDKLVPLRCRCMCGIF